jgi:hypothetical protein
VRSRRLFVDRFDPGRRGGVEQFLGALLLDGAPLRKTRGRFLSQGVIKPFRHLVRITKSAHHVRIGDRSASARKVRHAP